MLAARARWLGVRWNPARAGRCARVGACAGAGPRSPAWTPLAVPGPRLCVLQSLLPEIRPKPTSNSAKRKGEARAGTGEGRDPERMRACEAPFPRRLARSPPAAPGPVLGHARITRCAAHKLRVVPPMCVLRVPCAPWTLVRVLQSLMPEIRSKATSNSAKREKGGPERERGLTPLPCPSRAGPNCGSPYRRCGSAHQPAGPRSDPRSRPRRRGGAPAPRVRRRYPCPRRRNHP